mmetsp:Transcript_95587/g.275421  ORF Transcript_95587/g.275421 Transcript_95587/m.275421 type:complete len:1245 (-) Transcript_95587:98-3832(-)
MALEVTEDFEGEFVEVLPPEAGEDADPDDLRAAVGQRGRAWKGSGLNTNAVELFSGSTLELPARRLRRYIPPAAEAGGFDFAWPTSEELVDAFAWDVAERLVTKGFCVVQTFLGASLLADAAADAAGATGWKRFVEEFEAAYLGRAPKGKAAWLEPDDAGQEVAGGLAVCNRLLTETTLSVAAFSQTMLGFSIVGRTDGLLRAPFEGRSEEEALTQERAKLDDMAIYVQGRVEEHLKFVQQRRIGLFLCLRGSGASFVVHTPDGEDFTLPCEPGRLVIFRHDRLSFSYQPSPGEDDLALQAWMLAEGKNMTFQMYDGPLEQYDQALGLTTGPPAPAYGYTGMTVSLMSMDTMLAMNGSNPEFFWAALVGGTDGGRHLSAIRWDPDAYFIEDKDLAIGKYYSNHGGFVLEETCLAFDNEFFGMSEEQVTNTEPLQRNALEIGYSVLHKAGWTRGTLSGANIGVYVGNCGTDWAAVKLSPAITELTGDWLNALSAHALNGRLSYIFGMRGPVSTSDTACSSSLVATGTAHNALRRVEPDQLKVCNDSYLNWAVAIGTNGLWGPHSWIGLCGMKMLSSKGRCFTFDHTADGFARGEGTSGITMSITDKDHQGRLAMFCGTAINQDGRSASMTAPHGPSQQECLRASMREANIVPGDVRVAELHGTGTALGDPIEVGALRGVMRNRELPIIKTSAKCNLEHGEANAGMAGLIKCFLLLLHGTCPPNIHLKDLNPHIDTNAYPVLFADELVDLGTSSGYAGVSSFGFGGTNARGDLWAKAAVGVRRTGQLDEEKVDYITVRCAKCMGWMDHVGGMMMPSAPSKPPGGRFKSCCIRDEFATYDYCSACYTGGYQFGTPTTESPMPVGRLFIRGTFDGWRDQHEVMRSPDGECHFLFRLGETRMERFYFNVEKSDDFAIFPAVKRGGRDVRADGPRPLEAGQHWQIDGFEEGWSEGTLVHITLSADRESGVRRVQWAAVNADEAPALPPTFAHSYYVIGSWTAGQMVRMSPVRGDGSDGAQPPSVCYEYSTRIGVSGQETFHLARDADPEQLIYPAKHLAHRSGVPVRGPDHLGKSRRWAITGAQNETFRIRLEVSNGSITVSTFTPSAGPRRFCSSEAQRAFFVSGSWSDRPTPMETDPDRPHIHRVRVVMERNFEEFSVLVDEDEGSAFYPEAPGYPCGASFVLGPDDGAAGRRFQLEGQEGQVYEIALDLKSEDKRWIVSWRPVNAEGEIFLPWTSGAKYGICAASER